MPLISAVRLAHGPAGFRSGADRESRPSRARRRPPSISPGGVVPLDSTVNTIQPGEWVSIYGTNLASGTAFWNGDFPTSLGGTSVEINGKAAYLLLCQSRADQFAGAGRHGDGHGIRSRYHCRRQRNIDRDSESVCAVVQPA